MMLVYSYKWLLSALMVIVDQLVGIAALPDEVLTLPLSLVSVCSHHLCCRRSDANLTWILNEKINHYFIQLYFN